MHLPGFAVLDNSQLENEPRKAQSLTKEKNVCVIVLDEKDADWFVMCQPELCSDG